MSFYNETNGEAVFTTPTVGMVGLLEDIDRRCTQDFKHEGDVIVLLDALLELAAREGVPAMAVGCVIGDILSINVDGQNEINLPLKVINEKWRGAIACFLE